MISQLGKILLLVGVILAIIGAILTFANKVPFIGKLPGDLYIKKNNISIYFPLTTSIIISIILSVILYFLGRK